MTTAITLLITLLLAPLAPLHAADAAASPKPNIVFIYADDWGWGDLSCHGNTWLCYQREFAHASVFVDLETKKARIDWKP